MLRKRNFKSKFQTLETDKANAKNAKAEVQHRLDVVGNKKFLLDSLVSLGQQFDQLVTSLTQNDDKTGNSELGLFLRAENLEKAFDGRQSFWLEFESIVAGGNNRTRKNIIRYFSGAKVDYSGGIDVAWRQQHGWRQQAFLQWLQDAKTNTKP